MRETSGILTSKQRRYLENPEDADIDLGGAAERMTRKRIRERTLHGILDFQLLLEKQDAKDRKQVFERTEREKIADGISGEGRLRGTTSLPEKQPADELLGSVVDTIAYLYLGLLDRGMSKDGVENVFAKGVSRAVVQASDGEELPDVDVDIDIEFPSDRSAEEIFHAFMEGEDLTEEEKKLVLEHAPALPLQKAFNDYE